MGGCNSTKAEVEENKYKTNKSNRITVEKSSYAISSTKTIIKSNTQMNNNNAPSKQGNDHHLVYPKGKALLFNRVEK